VAIHRDIEGFGPLRPDPVGRLAGPREEHRDARAWRLATGTLACPGCDAPVAPARRPMSPAEPLSCPVCLRAGAVRDFLSLAAPARPARVEVRVVLRRGAAPPARRPVS
jgi:hypothetical protein